jgi:hypothetical protein
MRRLALPLLLLLCPHFLAALDCRPLLLLLSVCLAAQTQLHGSSSQGADCWMQRGLHAV